MDKGKVKNALMVIGGAIVLVCMIKARIGFYRSDAPVLFGTMFFGAILSYIGAKIHVDDEDEADESIVPLLPDTAGGNQPKPDINKSTPVVNTVPGNSTGKFCTQCGASNKSANSFCSQCGASISGS